MGRLFQGQILITRRFINDGMNQREGCRKKEIPGKRFWQIHLLGGEQQVKRSVIYAWKGFSTNIVLIRGNIQECNTACGSQADRAAKRSAETPYRNHIEY